MPFDSPTKIELTTAVREFMENQLLPELRGHLNFNTRVAINVLKIVERELTLGEEISKESKKSLLSLLQEESTSSDYNNRELNVLLSKEISQRKLSYQDSHLLDHLWKTTINKLAVDNPRYASYQDEKR